MYKKLLTIVFKTILAGCLYFSVLQSAEQIMDTIREPLFDTIRLDNDISDLGNKKLAEMGIVDVTAAPFNADATGKKDSTKALQQAIEFACVNQMVCFFPAGIYLVSDTLSCTEPLYLRQNGKTGAAGNFPNVLMGTVKSPKERAVIKLAPSAPGFNDPSRPKYIIHFWVRSQQGMEAEYPPSGNSSYSQMLINIDIEISEKNPGAVGVRMRAAQGSSIQDVIINAGYGLKGLEAGAGSGGSHHHVTVIGGEIGADLTEAQPAPTISGFTLIGQRKTALVYSGMETLCLVGCIIKSSGSGPLVTGIPKNKTPNEGIINLIDSILEFEKEGANTAVQSERSIYFDNVFVKNAAVILSAGTEKISGKNGWQHVRELAVGVDPQPHMGFQYITAPYKNGKQSPVIYDITAGEVPSGLAEKHIWPPAPNWEQAAAVNIKSAPWNAKGDGITDDTAALQKAIDENEIIFLPKGVYRITRTLKLKANTKLTGLSEKFSIIAVKMQTPFFADVNNQQPLLETADSGEASVMLAFMGTYTPSELTGASDLLWKCGGNSIVRSYHASHKPSVGYGAAIAPYDENTGAQVIITGNGGGRWYNWYQEGHGMVYGKDSQDQRFRQMVISNTRGQIAFYQMNPEGTESFARVEITGCQSIDIFGLKSEGNRLVIFGHDSKNIRIFGYGGNASAMPGLSLFLFKNVENLLVAGAMPRSAKPGQKLLGLSVSQDPNTWQLIIDEYSGKKLGTKPMERPAVYKRNK
ncbi:MAG: hypothetical protein A2096_07490 [Spirochaetes bacterium GWF1_41_5]|nr:MAG: hypothetical protein A2096_07490 [Spirochaetes bacterium GWF1_41_5]HBE02383.1 hypothetical protein [Spirochaetia bacterium]